MAYTDPRVITALIAVVGTFIAAILGATGYLYRTRLDARKSARKVLYLLLEIRYAIRVSVLDPKAVARDYLHYVQARALNAGATAEAAAIPAWLQPMIAKFFENICSTMATDIEERLLTPFEDALMDLASISPVLAYQLRGKEKVAKLIRHTSHYVSELSTALGREMPQQAHETAQRTAMVVEEKSVQETYDVLDRDVILLAKSCGWRDYRACLKLLDQNPPSPMSINFSEFDAEFDKIIAQMSSALALATDCEQL